MLKLSSLDGSCPLLTLFGLYNVKNSYRGKTTIPPAFNKEQMNLGLTGQWVHYDSMGSVASTGQTHSSKILWEVSDKQRCRL